MKLILFEVSRRFVGAIHPIKAFVYLDDIIVFGATIEEHNINIIKNFNGLKHYNLKIEPLKCKILHKQINYLGHTSNAEGIKPTKTNIDSIVDMPAPKTLKQLKSFLGAINFYGNFIPNVFEVRKPLH